MNLDKHVNKPVNQSATNPDLVTGHEPTFVDTLPDRVRQLLDQTSSKLAHNELREWGKLLLTQAPAIQAGIARRVDKRTVKKTAIAAVALGVGYYLLKRR